MNRINELRQEAVILSSCETHISNNINQLRSIHANCFIYEYMADFEEGISNKINELRELLKETRFNLHITQQRIEFIQSNHRVT